MTLDTARTTADSVADHVSDHNKLHSRYNAVIDVAAEYGSVIDGETDNTADIQAALTAADDLNIGAGIPNGPVVYLRTGRWRFSETLLWGHSPLVGDGPFNTHLYWDGEEGGTAITKSAGTKHGFGLLLIGGENKPGVWIDATADVAHDFGDWLEMIFFHDWSASHGVAAVKTGTAINASFRNVRFGGGAGPAVQCVSGGGRLTIDGFTLDSAAAGDDNFGGLLHLDYSSGQKTVVSIRDGRIESTGVDYAGPYGVVRVTGDGPAAFMIHMYDLDIDLGSPLDDTHYVVAGDSGNGDYSGHLLLQNIKIEGDVDPSTGYNTDNINFNIQDSGNILHYQLGGS